jgi:hypothetical protein
MLFWMTPSIRFEGLLNNQFKRFKSSAAKCQLFVHLALVYPDYTTGFSSCKIRQNRLNFKSHPDAPKQQKWNGGFVSHHLE